MKILAMSAEGSGAPLALNLKREGNEVIFYIKEHDTRDIYNGILDSVKDYKPHLKWCDYVFFAENKLSDIWEVCHKVKPCFGGSPAAQKLEKDRKTSHELMEGLGMQSPEAVTAKTVQECVDHLKEHPIKHVVKFVGKDCDSDDVFIGEYEDNHDLIRLAVRLEKIQKKKWDIIEIEEKIEGVEAGVEGYFDGHKFAPGIVVTFEHKKFAAGDKGQGVGFLTGEMGTLLKFTDDSNPFFKRTLAKMSPFLQSIDYRGEIHAGFILNKEGDWFVEHGPRKGYPDCVIRLECQVTPEGELYYAIAKGKATKNEYLPLWAMGVVVVSPGFPDIEASQKRSIGLPIIGYEEYPENQKHCHLFEARRGEDGLEISDGGYGYPLVVTGKGQTIEEAQRNAYWLLDPRNPNRICVPKGWYRSDIGERVLREKRQIIELGILTEEEFGGGPEPQKTRPQRIQNNHNGEGYIAVDLDKTLAYQADGVEEEIGPPIPEMAKRVMDWVAQGKEVRIMSARASSPEKIQEIKSWLSKNGFPPFEVGNSKSPEMSELYDDKAREVIPNTGKLRAEAPSRKNG